LKKIFVKIDRVRLTEIFKRLNYPIGGVE